MFYTIDANQCHKFMVMFHFPDIPGILPALKVQEEKQRSVSCLFIDYWSCNNYQWYYVWWPSHIHISQVPKPWSGRTFEYISLLPTHLINLICYYDVKVRVVDKGGHCSLQVMGLSRPGFETLFTEIYHHAGFISNQNHTPLLVDQELRKAVIRRSGGPIIVGVKVFREVDLKKQEYGWWPLL